MDEKLQEDTGAQEMEFSNDHDLKLNIRGEKAKRKNSLMDDN